MRKILFALTFISVMGISPMATAGCYCEIGHLAGNICLVPDVYTGRMAHFNAICTADAQPAEATPKKRWEYPYDDYCEARPKGGKICQHNYRGTQRIHHVAEYDVKNNVVYHREYYSDGATVKFEANFDSKGNRQGESKRYHENGQLSGMGHFVNGELHGEYRNFDKNGKLIRIEQYENGVLRSASEYGN